MSHMVDLVIFGGTGDLSTRKLLPALYQLQRHQLADRLNRIIATGRGELEPEKVPAPRQLGRSRMGTLLSATGLRKTRRRQRCQLCETGRAAKPE
jgi:glucose-6-phosphate 1-dehydrogenase